MNQNQLQEAFWIREQVCDAMRRSAQAENDVAYNLKQVRYAIARLVKLERVLLAVQKGTEALAIPEEGPLFNEGDHTN